MFEEHKAEGTAEWDQRQAFHRRLHEAILLGHNSFINEDIKTWHKALCILHTELASHIDEEIDNELGIKKHILVINNIIKNKARYRNLDEILMVFSETQQKLHQVMRKKGFDVPIKKKREGSVLESEGSY